MCPSVVNALLKKAGGVAPMTWEECETHNLKFYEEVFIMAKFDPMTIGEWDKLLKKIDQSPFVRSYHLMAADGHWHDKDTKSWKKLLDYVNREMNDARASPDGLSKIAIKQGSRLGWSVSLSTETGYVSYRTQIKQSVETAKRPEAEKTF